MNKKFPKEKAELLKMNEEYKTALSELYRLRSLTPRSAAYKIDLQLQESEVDRLNQEQHHYTRKLVEMTELYMKI